MLVGLTVCHGIAFCATIYRVSHRYHTRRLWGDDYFALLAFLVDILMMSMLWVYDKGLFYTSGNVTF